MTVFVTIVHVVVCLALIAIVLLQQGKGADIGAAFGAGASQTVFGGRGAGSFLGKLTTGSAILFMVTSLTLSYFAAPTTAVDLLEEEEIPIEGVLEPAEEEVPESTFPEPDPIEGEPDAGAAEGSAPEGFEAIPPPPEEPETP